MSGFTESDAQRLREAIASGVLTVRYDGPPARQVTYQTLTELRQALKFVEAELARSSGSSRVQLVGFRKGLIR